MSVNSEAGALRAGNFVKGTNEFVLLHQFSAQAGVWGSSLLSSKEDMQKYSMTWVQPDWKERMWGAKHHKTITSDYWSAEYAGSMLHLLPKALLGQAVNKLFPIT